MIILNFLLLCLIITFLFFIAVPPLIYISLITYKKNIKFFTKIEDIIIWWWDYWLYYMNDDIQK